jgi:hypothetical protein
MLTERQDRRQQQGHRAGAMPHDIPQYVELRLPSGHVAPAA